MNLYIDQRIRALPAIRTLEIFFEGYKSSKVNILPLEENSGYSNLEEISEVNPWLDFVREFIEFYIETLPSDFTEKDILGSKAVTSYIVNRLYAAKGYPEIFEVMNELLSTSYSEFHVEAEFEGAFLSKIYFTEFRTLELDNIITKLINALYYLILIDDIKILIDKLTLDIVLSGTKKTSILNNQINILKLEN